MNLQGTLKVKIVSVYKGSPEKLESELNRWLSENHVSISKISYKIFSYSNDSWEAAAIVEYYLK